MLQSEAGYIDARPYRQDRGNLLHRKAEPYIGVINRSSRHKAFSSARADYRRHLRTAQVRHANPGPQVRRTTALEHLQQDYVNLKSVPSCAESPLRRNTL